MKRIIWISNHPTNYLIFLFNYLCKHFDLKVYFLEYIRSTHPWSKLTELNFEYSILKNSPKNYFDIINRSKQENSILIIANWNSLIINFLQLYFSIAKQKFVIWTDTPNVSKKRNIIKKYIRTNWIKYLVRNSIGIMGTGMVAIEAFKKMGLDEDKLINFPFFVDLEKFKPKIDSPGFLSNDLIFLSSGRLVNSHKGYDVAIEALNIFQKKTGYKSFKYKIAGTGPDEKIIQELISKYNLEQNVELLGWLEEKQLLDFYYSGNVFLHPSRFDPFPNCVLEAMACGLPVIGSDAAGSVVDRIIHRENGLIFKSSDDKDLADKIELIYENRHLTFEYGKNARKNSEEWNIERSKEIITKIFNKVEGL